MRCARTGLAVWAVWALRIWGPGVTDVRADWAGRARLPSERARNRCAEMFS
jgi:hypothetical protein